MTIKTNYFDGNSYAAVDAVAPWAALLTDGIFGTSSGDLNVLAHSPANLSVDIQPGQGLKNGYFFNSDSIANVPIAANTSGYNRIDLIVANVDITNKVTTFTTVQGTPSSSPTAPLPNANQLVLAQAYVGNNVSVINQSNVTDVRQDVDLFGSQLAGKTNKSDYTKSLGTSGWRKTPDGFIEQWGIVSNVTNSGTYFNFPMAFPNTVYNVSVAPYLVNGSNYAGFTALSNTGMAVYHDGSSTAISIYYRVLGR